MKRCIVGGINGGLISRTLPGAVRGGTTPKISGDGGS